MTELSLVATSDLAPPRDIDRLLAELAALRAEIVSATSAWNEPLAALDAAHRSSGENLVYYLALRSHDLRAVQGRLAALGLSSLGRAEGHVLAAVDAVLAALRGLVVGPNPPTDWEAGTTAFLNGRRRLAANTERLLGSVPPGRGTRIMVTMPSEAADDYSLVHDLVRDGMNCMRINCAHDDRAKWERMIAHLRRAETALGTTCRILMDLAGPKLRTGPVEPGPAVVKIRPVRDALGQVTAPARVWLSDQDSPRRPPSPADAALVVPGAWLAGTTVGERVTFRDSRGSRRAFRIVDVTSEGCWGEARKTAYVLPGTRLLRRGDHHARGGRVARVGPVPPLENALRIDRGDALVLTRGLTPGRAATRDARGAVLTPASIGCTLDQVFEDVKAGEAIWFDDGRIGGVVERVEPHRLTVRINHVPVGGATLKGDKGINLPDSVLHVPALTPKDLADLPFVMAHADLVALSFASAVEDVALLQEQMARVGGRQPAIVLKIETRRGFEHLPGMLMAAMRMPSCGVMIARGDLAVETGFERLAEVQEEILWICEAAHVPVIWATQVLETLAKHGVPSRAEITDAAMGHRAECVMLNKGPHVLEAVRTLDDILRRMQSHQDKKRSMLRALRLARDWRPG